MRTHLGCIGRVALGEVGRETREKLEQLQASWLELTVDPAALVVRHVQPSDTPILPNVAGELLEFLGRLTDSERVQVPGGELYCLDEETGQYVRLKVSAGGFLTVAWAQPDYTRARWMPYHGERVPVVLDAYQRLNGVVTFLGQAGAADGVRAAVERSAGLYPEGEFNARVEEGRAEIRLGDVNASVLPLIEALRVAANPVSSLEGEIEVSSFRPGDLEDYCRFVFRGGEVWLVRPALWTEAPREEIGARRPLESAA